MSNQFDVGRRMQICKIELAMGFTIGFDAEKIGNNTHLLVIMRVRLLQKIGLHNLMNLRTTSAQIPT